MDSVFLATCKMMPEEELLDRLDIALSRYKIDPNEENRDGLHMYITMAAINITSKDVSLEKMVKDHDRLKKLDETFKNTQQ